MHSAVSSAPSSITSSRAASLVQTRVGALITEKFIIEDWWTDAKIFMYIAYSLTGGVEFHDIFSRISIKTSVYDFLLLQFTLGTSWSYMNLFIKQYTHSLNFTTNLNPLLRGITICIMLQDFLLLIRYSNDLTTVWKYLYMSMKSLPDYEKCTPGDKSCVTLPEMFHRCEEKATNVTELSLYQYYTQNVMASTNFTVTLLITMITWVSVFLFATMNTTSLMRFYKLSFMYNIIITIIMAFFVTTQPQPYLIGICYKLFTVDNIFELLPAMKYLNFVYYIGLLGICDFSTLSPHMKISNAVLSYAVVVFFIKFLQSAIFRLLYEKTMENNCVNYNVPLRNHDSGTYVAFVLVPLASDFFLVKRFITIYTYTTLVISTYAHLTLTVAIISKMINNEFKTFQEIYVTGLVCFLQYICDILYVDYDIDNGLDKSVSSATLVLAGLKSIVVMWVYGVPRFSTDIEFWLNCKTSMYWKLCWAFQPIWLMFLAILVTKSNFSNLRNGTEKKVFFIACGTSFALLLFVSLKTIINCMTQSELSSAFRASVKYGPPDRELRRKRRKFATTRHLRDCDHRCIVLDESATCPHMGTRDAGDTAATAESVLHDKSETSARSFDRISMPD